MKIELIGGPLDGEVRDWKSQHQPFAMFPDNVAAYMIGNVKHTYSVDLTMTAEPVSAYYMSAAKGE
ncbi:MAG: hypothetical protein HUJ26_12635 [Planctomycetaceae bacterium]|nr:hypothetical protein [Planctomycetaceae bacterium]